MESGEEREGEPLRRIIPEANYGGTEWEGEKGRRFEEF